MIAHGDHFGQLLQNRFKARGEGQGFLINVRFFMAEQGGVEE
jgi:hypothetical protein